MRATDFDFKLPPELIAQHPLPGRSDSRLLCLDRKTGAIQHRQFAELPHLLSPKDLIVFNDTRVIPARLRGVKESGGKVEVLVERVLDEHRVLAHVKASKALKPGGKALLEREVEVVAGERVGDLFTLQFLGTDSVLTILQQYGHIPLPPYINREAAKLDRERYQTVFARRDGAVAAPTAGLHFTSQILQSITKQGAEIAYITLHVGAGTFQPVRVQNIHDHKMHSEWLEVSAEVCAKIIATKQRGGRVIAVGTTCVRSLETAAQSGEVQPFSGDTDIFIYPGFKFNCVDAIVTNFHLPKSTLLMLVSAFAGREQVLKAYNAAVAEKYRFFSYGDAMFVR